MLTSNYRPQSNTEPDLSLSSSPAAHFLSFFHNPQTAASKPDDEGQVISGYTLGSIIGHGSSSTIRRASSPAGTLAAVKIVLQADLVLAGNAPQARKRLQHEASIWASLSHEHILPLFSTVHTPYADFFFTLYCPAGSLFDILKRDGNPALPQDEAGMMFRQIVRGLRYLHDVAGYVHRDLKLENILVDDLGVCKIGDFGLSRKIGYSDEPDEQQDQYTPTPPLQFNSNVHRNLSLAAPSSRRPALQLNHSINRHNTTRHRNSTPVSEPIHSLPPGSLPYAAPELLLPQTSDALCPHPSQDIWALGVVLYALLTGSLPFSDAFEPRLQMKILQGTYLLPEGIGRGAERILQGCLNRSVSSRWTIKMVDDVAWGVGWGSEGDIATASDSLDALEYPSISRSRSRSSDIRRLNIDWSQIEINSRPSASSRTKPSISRPPILTDNLSSSRSQSRSISRHPSQLSLRQKLRSCEGFSHDSALVISPSSSASSAHRGRRQTKHHLPSRSPSPSMVPTTPIDGPLVPSPAAFMEQPDDLHLDPEDSRGRSTMRTKKLPAHNRAGFEADLGDWVSKDLVDHDAERHLSSTRAAVRNNNNNPIISAELSWLIRASSSPPTGYRLRKIPSSNLTVKDRFLNSSPTTSNSNLVLRSRSADTDRY